MAGILIDEFKSFSLVYSANTDEFEKILKKLNISLSQPKPKPMPKPKPNISLFEGFGADMYRTAILPTIRQRSGFSQFVSYTQIQLHVWMKVKFNYREIVILNLYSQIHINFEWNLSNVKPYELLAFLTFFQFDRLLCGVHHKVLNFSIVVLLFIYNFDEVFICVQTSNGTIFMHDLFGWCRWN